MVEECLFHLNKELPERNLDSIGQETFLKFSFQVTMKKEDLGCALTLKCLGLMSNAGRVL